MSTSTQSWFWRSSKSNWIWMACFIGLAACVAGLTFSRSFRLADWYRQSPQIPEVPGQSNYRQGCELIAQGKLPEAVAAFDAALARDRLNEQALIGRAKARQLQGDTSRAIDDYCRALDINAGNAEAYCGRGSAYLEKGWYELAIDDLTAAKALAPNSHEAACRRAQAYLAAGKADDAIADARLAIQMAANDGPAYLALGSAILSSPKEKPDRAIEYLKYAMRIDNKLAPLAYAKAGRAVEANNAFDVAQKLNPKGEPFPPPPSPLEKALAHAKTLLADGMNLLAKLPPRPAQDQFDGAVEEFTAILLTDPKNVEALLGRASAFIGKKDWDAAVADLDQLIERNPSSAEAYCLRAQAYLNKGDYYMAKRDATQAIRLTPDYAFAYYYRAAACCKTTDYETALANLDEVKRLDGMAALHDRDLRNRAGDLYVEIRQSQARDYGDARQCDRVIDCSFPHRPVRRSP